MIILDTNKKLEERLKLNIKFGDEKRILSFIHTNYISREEMEKIRNQIIELITILEKSNKQSDKGVINGLKISLLKLKTL